MLSHVIEGNSVRLGAVLPDRPPGPAGSAGSGSRTVSPGYRRCVRADRADPAGRPAGTAGGSSESRCSRESGRTPPPSAGAPP